MTRLKWVLPFAMLAVRAQQVPSAEFAVASVRANLTGDAEPKLAGEEKITVSPSSLIMWNTTLRSCIRWAYDLRDYQIFAPAWMESRHYDISAKTSGDVSPREMRLMLQRLLAERFHLAVRSETKELPVYAMSLGGSQKKRERFKAAAAGADPASVKPVDGTLEFRGYSMADLAERLGARPFKLDRLVIDRTGLEGRFDFKIEFASGGREMKQALEDMELNNTGTASMLTFLHEQLGLAFRAEKAPIESLVVERADKIPVGN